MISPYKGLLPYDAHDQSNFFGRERDKEILLGKILSHKLTLLYAATGVGKSSLLGAAVIPELEAVDKENLDVAYHRSWITDPLAAIQETVRSMLQRRQKVSEDEVVKLHSRSLQAFFRHCGNYSSDPLVLVLDQFEEIFRYHAGLSHFVPFIDQLSQVMTDRDLPVAVVLSMREDFLAELSVFKGKVPELYQNYYRLQRLTLQQAREAIVKPVEQPAVGFRYEVALLEQLLKDLAERDREYGDMRSAEQSQRAFTAVEGPYLQIVCLELWRQEQHNPGKTMRNATYTALGGANAIVQRYFEQIMAECTVAERHLAARAFAFLVTEWGTKMAYPEGVLAKILRVKLEQLQPVLRHLNAARILRDEQRPEGTWYELYHDVFARIIDAWSRTFREKRRRRVRAALVALSLALLAALGVAGYERYLKVQQEEQIARKAGELQVHNATGAALSITCVRRYDSGTTCAVDEVPVKGTVMPLEGPADYLLTARGPDAWTVQYPVYIQYYGHRVTVTVHPPPAHIPAGMVYIPGGVFRMGDKDDRDAMGKADELPHHDVEVSAFFLDAYEVTNARYVGCVQAGACSEPHYEDGTCVAFPQLQVSPGFREAAKPVVCVDWSQAVAFCQYEQKRLPTEAEWEKAAAGPAGYKWPFGNTFYLSMVNNAESDLDTTTPVGTYAPNGYGLYDMSGNVWEWVADWYDPTFYSRPAATQKDAVNRQYGSGDRVRRGGSWYLPAEAVRSARREADRPNGRDTHTGFRCAQALP
jgi:formylglycine-generating enzyme required for sulfatase activity